MGVPPRVVRRLVVAPLVAATELALVVVSPLILSIAALASPAFGGWRPLRAAGLVVSFAAHHLVATIACLGLWLGSGLGWRLGTPRVRDAHYAVMRWFVSGVYRDIVRIARVEVAVEETEAAREALDSTDRPVLVLSRHAGEGDTLLVIHELVCRHRLAPRVVMHHALQLDPLIDALGNRLPNRFVDPRGGDTEHEIAAMAGELGDGSALIIFPEGANFSEQRRVRAIERLEAAGHDAAARWAREIHHLSPPRPGGTLAAIGAAQGADILIMGHVGFPTGIADVWRHLPEHQTIEVGVWHLPPSSVPDGRDEQISWLFDRWRALDAWVGERASAPATVA
jgi:1-acyl-sn-glycerol-3-phosphate acyltransferase